MPTDLRDFLKAYGWSLLQRGLRERLYVLENPMFPGRQLVFPMDLTTPDYLDSTDSVVSKLAGLTGQVRETLVSKIHCLRDDVIRLRVFFDGDDSAVPMSFASTLIRSTEKLLKAAACTALRPRTHHPRLTLTEATQFVDNARFGQTESGSYVLRVTCPINSMDIQGNLQLETHDAPFVRQVTMSLQRALAQLTRAIEADTVDNLIDELRSVELHDEDTFIGTVERLDGEMGADGRRSGVVILSLLLADEGETVRARTVLSADDYAKADDPHMTNGAYVRVRGRLRPGHQPRQLTETTVFEVLPQASR